MDVAIGARTRSIGKRVGAAILASLAGLLVGATAAGVLGALLVLTRPGIEMASRRALIVAPLALLAEGFVWAVIGGTLFVLPLAVLALAVFRPPDSPPSARWLSAILVLPIVLGSYPSRLPEALVMAVPVWLGTRVSLRLFARLMRS